MTWGTVFAAYPDLQIVHRAGRVHSNVDPTSQLRRRIPYYVSPLPPNQEYATLKGSQESLSDFYENIAPQFEECVLLLATSQSKQEELEHLKREQVGRMVQTLVPMKTEAGIENILYTTSQSHSIQVQITP